MFKWHFSQTWKIFVGVGALSLLWYLYNKEDDPPKSTEY